MASASTSGTGCAQRTPVVSGPGSHTGSSFTAHRKRGFALIISLMLMGFLLLMVLSLSSLVQTDLASSTIDQQSSNARQNALLGLQTAIGKLQQYAGPDQAVTARADIEDAQAANPYWTGVWDKDGTLLTYLVSGNENGTQPPQYDGSSELSTNRNDAKAAILLANGATDTDPDVLAKLVKIKSNGTEGGYAYWISDESVKAKINLLPSTRPSGAPENFGLMVPQQFGFTDLKPWFDQSTLFNPNGGLNEANLQKLQATIDMGTLSAYRGGSTKDLLHDVTFYSYGVLSNPRTGGLKKDLTAAFEGNLDSALKDRNIIAGKADTPLWNQLHNWVMTTPDANNALPVQGATNEQAGIYPVLLGFQLYMVPAYQAAGADERLFNYIVPTVALWNPYNHPLKSTSYKILAGRAQKGNNVNHLTHVGGSTFSQSYVIFLEQDTNPMNSVGDRYEQDTNREGKDALRGILNPYSGGNYVHDETLEFTIPDVTLAPGEVQIYTAERNQPFKVGSGNVRKLVAENNPYGFYIDLQRTLHKDPSSGGLESLRRFKHSGIIPARVGALQLSIDGGEVLSDAVYLNQAPSPDYPVEMDIQSFKGPQEDLMLYDVSTGVNTRAFGWLAMRNMGINTRNPLPQHRERNQLDADYKWLAHYNPRAATSGPHPINYRASKTNYDTSTTINPSFISLADHHGEAVNSVGDLVATIKARSSNGIVLFEASPGIENLFTIGQLTHAPLFYWDDTHSGTNYSPANTTRVRPRMENASFDNLIPANPIGNSRANPAIPLDKSERPMEFGASEGFSNFTKGNLYDYSYLLNQALWDEYFFSAVTSSGNDTDGNPLYSASRNPRMVLLPDKTQVERGLNTSAESLLIDGPFNVNSTSINAWKALLTSFYGRTPGDADRISAANSETVAPFMRIADPAHVKTKINPRVNDEESYIGYHTLDEDQIDALAKAIVEEIRLRGPATSLSAFINRSLSGTEDLQIQGTLSAAIEKAQLSNSTTNAINKELRADGQESSQWRTVTASNLQSQAAAEGYVTEGLPGWLTSADILSRLGSVLSPRGDTFLIRAYGEYGTDNNLSKAWCEAVVQRLPETIDSADPQTPPDTSRRFVIAAFRWLSPSEL